MIEEDVSSQCGIRVESPAFVISYSGVSPINAGHNGHVHLNGIRNIFISSMPWTEVASYLSHTHAFEADYDDLGNTITMTWILILIVRVGVGGQMEYLKVFSPWNNISIQYGIPTYIKPLGIFRARPFSLDTILDDGIIMHHPRNIPPPLVNTDVKLLWMGGIKTFRDNWNK